MIATERAALSFSREELFYLIEQIGAGGMSGVDSAPLAQWSPQGRQMVLEAAERALLARGTLAQQDQAIVLDVDTRQLIEAAACADTTLTAVMRARDSTALFTLIYHHAAPLWVEHTQKHDGIHTLQLTAGVPPICESLATLLGVAWQPAANVQPFQIGAHLLDQLQQLIRNGERAPIRELLTAQHVPLEDATQFGALLIEPHDATIIQMHNRRGGSDSTRTVTILRGEQGFWLMEGDASGALRCAPISAATVRQLFDALISDL